MTHDLDRFITAQELCYSQAVGELSHGRKVGHWMWYIFPQIKGLGQSPTSRTYAISSLAEARAYDTHPILGPRLRQCTTLVNQIAQHSLKEIFGHTDAMKFQSCMTLFCKASADPALFQAALDTYCDGIMDQMTLDILESEWSSHQRQLLHMASDPST